MSADASASSLVPAQAPAQEPTAAPEPAAEAPAAVSGRRPAGARAALLHRRLGLARPGAGGRGPGRPPSAPRCRSSSPPPRSACSWRPSGPPRSARRAVASVFGIFGGFWLSYAVLSLGLTHGWFGIAAHRDAATQELFLVAWLVVIVMLTLATLRLPMAYTAVFVLVDRGAGAGLPRRQRRRRRACSRRPGRWSWLFAAVGVYLYSRTACRVPPAAHAPARAACPAARAPREVSALARERG